MARAEAPALPDAERPALERNEQRRRLAAMKRKLGLEQTRAEE